MLGNQNMKVQQSEQMLWGDLAAIPMSYRGPCALPHVEIHFTGVETGPAKGCSDTLLRIDIGKQDGIKQKKTMTVRTSH